jgi:hypothetical protein
LGPQNKNHVNISEKNGYVTDYSRVIW